MDLFVRERLVRRGYPELDEVVDVIIDDAFNWIFPVDDGEVKLALSCEKDGTVHVARIDPLGLKSGNVVPSWQKLFDTADLEADSLKYYSADEGTSSNDFTKVADHFHIYAHGYHWIACSISGDTEDDPVGVYLVKFTLSLGGTPTVIWQKVVKTAFDIDDYILYSDTDPYGVTTSHYSARWPTNDLLLVEAEDNCVAIGVYQRSKYSSTAVADPTAPIAPAEPDGDEGHSILIVDENGKIHSDEALIGRRVKSGHTNGGSARLSTTAWLGSSQYRFLVPTSILTNYETKLLLITTDADSTMPFTPDTVTTLLDGEGAGYHYSMAMEASAGAIPRRRGGQVGLADFSDVADGRSQPATHLSVGRPRHRVLGRHRILLHEGVRGGLVASGSPTFRLPTPCASREDQLDRGLHPQEGRGQTDGGRGVVSEFISRSDGDPTQLHHSR